MLEEYWLAGAIFFALGCSVILFDLRHRLSEKRIALYQGECKRLLLRQNVDLALIEHKIEEKEWLKLIMLTYKVGIDELTNAVRKSEDWRTLFHEDLQPYMDGVY